MVAVFSSFSFAESPEQKGLSIVRESDNRNKGYGDSVADASMKISDGKKVLHTYYLKSKVLEGKDGDKALIVFERPKDIQGTSLLTHTHSAGGDDQWMYLPATKRVKRIAGSNKSAPFVGSEFTYEDMVPMVVSRYTYKFINQARCAGGQCQVVERYPKDSDSGYQKTVMYIDAEYRLQKAVFHDKSGKLLKTLTLSNYKKYGKYWRSLTNVMKNAQNGRVTTIAWDGYQFKTGLGDRDLDENALRRMK
jgi:hypothetical protein